jgi:hypothetical protein
MLKKHSKTMVCRRCQPVVWMLASLLLMIESPSPRWH